MKRSFTKLLLCACGLLTAAVVSAQDLQQYLDYQIQSGSLKGAAVGVCVKEIGGKTLVSHNSSTRMVPASNLKLVTTGAALHAFGPEYRFQTELAYSGTISPEGTLNGDLYIVGGGDPTIGAPDSTAYKADALFWKWKTLLQAAGIRKIDGNIIGDGRAWEGNLENDGWEYGDVGTYYAPGTDALCFYENTIDFQVSAGAAVGEPVPVKQLWPETPWLKFENRGVTGPAGTGNSLLLRTSDLTPNAVMDGSFAIDRKPKKEQAANKYGALTCAHAFWKNLKASGWDVSGTFCYARADGKLYDGALNPIGEAAQKRESIGQSQSPALSLIARKTNYDSDNFYAEALLRAMGEAASGCAQYDSSLVAIKDVLVDIVPSTDGLIQKDGSGLSRANSISPEWLCTYLEAMVKSPAFPAYLESLPRPGEGSLYMLRTLPAWKFRFKSGSMGGVLCYSGYVLDGSGKPRLSFSILCNSLSCKPSEARAALESLIQLIGKI